MSTISEVLQELKQCYTLTGDQQKDAANIIDQLEKPALSNNCKISALKWVLLVKDFLSVEARATLHRIYDILFHYLDYGNLCPLICKILYQITKRSDVTKFRAKKLAKLVKNSIENGSDSYDLYNLAEQYERFVPGSVLSPDQSKPVYTNRKHFGAPDEIWQSAIRNVISEKDIVKRSNEDEFRLNPFITERKAKKAKTKKQHENARAFIPPVTNKENYATNVVTSMQVALADIKKIEDLGHVLVRKKLVLPERCSSILGDRIFQHVFCLQPSEEAIIRMRHNLTHMLEEEFFGRTKPPVLKTQHTYSDSFMAPRGLEDYHMQEYILKALSGFADFLQETAPHAETFLFKYLSTWNGVHHFEGVLSLISRLHPRSYKELYAMVFQPIYRIYFVTSAPKKCRIIEAFAALLENWALIDWERHLQGMDSGKVFSRVSAEIDHFQVIYKLVNYVDSLLLQGLILESNHPLIQLSACQFYERVVSLCSKHSLPFVIPPSTRLTHRILLSTNAFAIDCMCEILYKLRDSYEKLRINMESSIGRAMKRSRSPIYRAAINQVSTYNSVVTDYCNSLWLSKILHRRDRSRLIDNEVNKTLDNVSNVDLINKALSLTNSLAFIGFCIRCRDNIQGRSNIPSEKDYLQFLSSTSDLNGVMKFLNMFLPATKV